MNVRYDRLHRACSITAHRILETFTMAMGGSNMYCAICNGPTCSSFIDIDGLSKQKEGGRTYDVSFDALPGIIYDDQVWLSESSVVIYADYITLPGHYGEFRHNPSVFLSYTDGTSGRLGFLLCSCS